MFPINKLRNPITACARNVHQNYQTILHHGMWQSGEETNLQRCYNNTYTLFFIQLNKFSSNE